MLSIPYLKQVSFACLLSLAMLQPASSLNAQPDKDDSDTDPASMFNKNGIKLNVSSLLLNNINLSYERMLTRKISATVGYRTMPTRTLDKITLAKKIIESVEEDGGTLKEDLSKMSFTNNAYTAEFRLYGGKKDGARGVYVGLYGRYATFDLDYTYDYNTGTQNYIIPIRSSTNGFGAGLLFGVQFNIAKRIILDMHILGGHYGSLKGDVDAIVNLSSMSETDKQELKRELDELIIIGNKQVINSQVSNSGVKATIDGPFAGLRALGGVTIGFAF
jgi:hypothetical protein